MTLQTPPKKCLIISYGPVPTPQYQTVEGGGMRAWGLADGLKSHDIAVTIGVNTSFPQDIPEHNGVTLINWSLDNDFIQLINSFDAVIVSYCMGDPSVFIADNINDDIQLVLDAYVPIYIEVSARDSKDVVTEYVNYAADIQRFNRVLKRGDYFLYANSAQEQLYSGVLSALGIINPYSYRIKRLVQTPFGIHRIDSVSKHNPYKELGIDKDADFTVLWFGGIYPWFRVEEYLEAIKLLAKDKQIKFVFVGGKNPFNPNPDFSRQYDTTYEFAKSERLIDKQVFFVDWVDFDTRINWFKNADVIVSLNQPGEENKYSWRTRVMDYVWGEAVTISNGGDPLSDELIDKECAIKLADLSAKSLVNAIESVKQKPELLKKLSSNIIELKEKYYWDVVTDELSQLIKKGDLPYSEESKLRNQLTPSPILASNIQPTPSLSNNLMRIAKLPVKVVRKVRQKGVIRSAKVAGSILKTQFARQTIQKDSQFVFISHPINYTGAPTVLLQVIEEFVEKYGAKRVRVIAPGIEPGQRDHLRALGVNVEQAVYGAGFRFIRAQLALKPNDFVLMNTIAIYDNYRDFVLMWLRLNRLNHAYWFIHEDKDQIPVINKQFLDPKNISQISEAVNARNIDLLFPSKRTAQEYNELLGIKSCHSINLRVEVPSNLMSPRNENDFNKIDLLISGTSSDGRKGQVLALSALQHFIDNYYSKDPTSYRPVSLHLVAITKDDYLSQQIRWISNSILKDHVQIYEPLPKDEALQITRKCNVVLCASLNETFGLYIAEGMLMGHIVLRNNCSGVDEQLEDGVNGYLIDHTDIIDIASRIEQIANKSKTTNANLSSMSKASQQIINEFVKYKYIDQIER